MDPLAEVALGAIEEVELRADVLGRLRLATRLPLEQRERELGVVLDPRARYRGPLPHATQPGAHLR